MLALSTVLLIFRFQFSGLFFHISRQAAQLRIGLCNSLCNTRHRTLPNIWVGTFLVWSMAQGNDFKLILTITVETRHPREGQFGSEFPAICNHCRVMAA